MGYHNDRFSVSLIWFAGIIMNITWMVMFECNAITLKEPASIFMLISSLTMIWGSTLYLWKTRER